MGRGSPVHAASGRDAARLKARLVRWAFAAWVVLVAAFAAAHAVHLQADFPNHSPWHFDYAKYTDEGWYGNAAVRAHDLGHWYVAGDFNPAPAVPVWPFLEWMLFSVTGVGIEPARALAVGFFFAELVLSYTLLRVSGSRWMALLAVTLAVTSPFLYAFSRLAILEPMLLTLLLAALNLAVRLPRWRYRRAVSAGIGVLFTLMLLTKTTAVFLAPALAWGMLAALRGNRREQRACAGWASATAAATFGGWVALVAHAGLLRDYRYFFFVNTYPKPPHWWWPLLSLWWSLKGALWIDHVLIPLAGVVVMLAIVAHRGWGRRLWGDPVFGASVLALTGYVVFMTYQNHPQPRYYVVVALFAFFVLAMGVEVLLAGRAKGGRAPVWRLAGIAALGVAMVGIVSNGARTAVYVAHPEYTWVNAARGVARYMDEHPNGNRLLVSVSGDEISMITRVPALCDGFGTEDLPDKLARYRPGWWATWNDVDPGILEDLHVHYSLEQVGSFPAFDDPDRNVLVLFKLHPLPGGTRELAPELRDVMPGDKIDIPVE